MSEETRTPPRDPPPEAPKPRAVVAPGGRSVAPSWGQPRQRSLFERIMIGIGWTLIIGVGGIFVLGGLVFASCLLMMR